MTWLPSIDRPKHLEVQKLFLYFSFPTRCNCLIGQNNVGINFVTSGNFRHLKEDIVLADKVKGMQSSGLICICICSVQVTQINIRTLLGNFNQILCKNLVWNISKISLSVSSQVDVSRCQHKTEFRTLLYYFSSFILHLYGRVYRLCLHRFLARDEK